MRIVAVTASAFASERESVLGSGVDDFIRKPFRPDEMFDCLARHLNARYRLADAEPERPEQWTLDPEEFTTLPDDLRREVGNALIGLDNGQIARIIVRIGELNPVLGSRLMDYSTRLAFSEMLNAIRPDWKVTAHRS